MLHSTSLALNTAIYCRNYSITQQECIQESKVDLNQHYCKKSDHPGAYTGRFCVGGRFIVEAGAAGSGAGPLAGAFACLCASLALSRDKPPLESHEDRPSKTDVWR